MSERFSPMSAAATCARFAATIIRRITCRVSTADQTCARQERDLRAFAKKTENKGTVRSEISSWMKVRISVRRKAILPNKKRVFQYQWSRKTLQNS
jgi:hypothetical protein